MKIDKSNLRYSDMFRMIDEGQQAFDYIWEHYEELVSRPATYYLYGPKTHYLGILASGHIVPPKERKVHTRVRWKEYCIYELDENFKPIRIKHVNKYQRVHCTYHLFEQDGVIYARGFFEDRKIPISDDLLTIKQINGRTAFFSISKERYLFADYYEYPTEGTVETSSFLFLPGATEKMHNAPVMNWDAPYGASDSPVTLDYRVEPYLHIDFKSYFNNTVNP